MDGACMKVLVVCQHYAPENFRVTEICEDLVARGHQVVAVVGLPNYPSGIVPREYKWFRRRRENLGGVQVRRCFEIGRKNTPLGLAINYVSYMVAACWKVLTLRHDYDVIYAYSTSPVLMSLPASLLRCFTCKKLVIYVLDIWPACLAAMNVGEGSPLYAFMKRVSRWVYGKADVLLVGSKRFQQYMEEVHGMTVPDQWYLPQFADGLFEQAAFASPKMQNAFAKEEPSKTLTHLVFAGNIGRVQGVQTLLQAAALLQKEPIYWHFLGDGSDFESCQALARELGLEDQVTFYGRRPLADMPAFYAMADALLVSMHNDASVNDTLPGKVQSYMAAGKPLLCSITGETPYILQQAGCGLCAPPDDPQAFAQVVLSFFAMSQEARSRMGENGRVYYQQHFTQQRHMDRLEALLLSLTKEG